MKTEWKVFLLCMFAVLVGRLSAQTAASLVQVDYVQGPISGCVTHTGTSTFCYGTDGFAFSKAGAAYGSNLATLVGGGVLTVNGKKPDSTGNVSLTPVVTEGTISVPASTVTPAVAVSLQ